MTLVVWNQALTEGIGRSGTHYTVSWLKPRPGSAAGWLVTVDDEDLYLSDDARAAVVRAEHLEALRCVLRGLSGEMTDGELNRAVAVAEEMSRSALRTIVGVELTREQRHDLEESLGRLRQAQEEVAVVKRYRAQAPSTTLH
jgi:hypothetical protein